MTQRPCGIEQPRQRLAKFAARRRLRACEVPFDVVDGARQHVQLVMERIEFRPCHHQFVLTQRKFGCSLPGHPVPLATSTRTENPGSAGARSLRECSTTPSAVSDRQSSAVTVHRVFRHDVIVPHVGWLARRRAPMRSSAHWCASLIELGDFRGDHPAAAARTSLR
jgi:hypothetical protein